LPALSGKFGSARNQRDNFLDFALKTLLAMGTPQDPRARRRQRKRRAKKNVEWELKRAHENAEAAKPKTPAKTAT